MVVAQNPLLGNYGLPTFDKIQATHVRPAIDEVLTLSEQCLLKIEANPTVTWDTLLAPLEFLRRIVHNVWGPVQHLIGVKNSPELREAFEATLPKIVSFSLRLSQSKAIYRKLKVLRDGSGWKHLNLAQRRAVDHLILQAKLSGIELEGLEQERLNEITQRLSKLQTSFSNNVLDATKDFLLTVHEPKSMEDVPFSFREMWAEIYARKHPGTVADAAKGPWAVTLDFPSYMPFLKYCKDRNLREQLYRSYITRASQGKLDNTPLIYEILRLRQEQARLLGYKNYAEVSLAMKMAGSVERVLKLLNDLAQVSTSRAKEELQELRIFAQKQGLTAELQNWDLHYYLEKMRQEKFNFSDDELRPYFPLPQVLKGLFNLVEKLFGIKVVENRDAFPRWHPDVSMYTITDLNGHPFAAFYLDPYSRPAEKRGGAWMDTCLDRGSVDGKPILPVAYLVCNGTPPMGSTPSLLSFEEVETLFHEFGHGLQHMLTQVDALEVSGINGIEWDAVELPSQFMENWCYQKTVLQSLTKHVKTGEVLPDELFQKIAASKTFNAANLMVRQLHFAFIDMELHASLNPDGIESIDEVNRAVAARICAIQPLAEDRFLCAFEHIFSSSYAAGYYSYKWAEVLSADAFSRFEEEGLDTANIARVGRDFRETVLALGGSIHPMDVFKKFRGREPDVTALLRHNGLILEDRQGA